MNFLGEMAALATSFCFSLTSTQFTLAGRRTGSITVNRSRLILATLFLLAAHPILGIPYPMNASIQRWFWLGTSGIVGLVIGDAFLFQAFIWIGARLSMLLMALVPVIASIFAWLFLDEQMTGMQILGIGITLGGIAWVVLERNNQQDKMVGKDYSKGLLYGVGAATGQALGLVLAKPGLAGNFPAVSGTLMRMGIAMVTIWVLAAIYRQVGTTITTLKQNPRALIFILGGAFTGPFIGVTLSLYAIQHTEVGIASTLMALPPVFLLPISRIIFKERFSWQAIAGTLVALAGVAMLFLD